MDKVNDPDLLTFIREYLLIKVAAKFDGKKNPRLYTQFFFTILFDIPSREKAEQDAF